MVSNFNRLQSCIIAGLDARRWLTLDPFTCRIAERPSGAASLDSNSRARLKASKHWHPPYQIPSEGLEGAPPPPPAALTCTAKSSKLLLHHLLESGLISFFAFGFLHGCSQYDHGLSLVQKAGPANTKGYITASSTLKAW